MHRDPGERTGSLAGHQAPEVAPGTGTEAGTFSPARRTPESACPHIEPGMLRLPLPHDGAAADASVQFGSEPEVGQGPPRPGQDLPRNILGVSPRDPGQSLPDPGVELRVPLFQGMGQK